MAFEKTFKVKGNTYTIVDEIAAAQLEVLMDIADEIRRLNNK